MTRQETNVYLAAILTTLLEFERESTSGAPESSLYLACGGDYDKWTALRSLLLQGSLVTIKSNLVRLTNTGRDVALKCEAKVLK